VGSRRMFPSCHPTTAAFTSSGRACPSRTPAPPCRGAHTWGTAVRSGFRCSPMMRRWSATMALEECPRWRHETWVRRRRAHRQRDDGLESRRAADALGPEGAQRVRIGGVVPRPVPRSAATRRVPHQRLVVARVPIYDAVLAGQRPFSGFVVIEGAAPHRGPQQVGLQPQQQFEDRP